MLPAHNVVDAVVENPFSLTVLILLAVFVFAASIYNMVTTHRERKLRKAAEAALTEMKRADG